MPKIYTKTGDSGETGLLSNQRFPKDHALLEAYGTIDELNALLGLVRTKALSDQMQKWLIQIQNELFDIGADLACPWEGESSNHKEPIKRIEDSWVKHLEEEIDEIEKKLPPLTQFILPSGSEAASFLHLARTVCRRAERKVVTLYREKKCNPIALKYLNRLSDWLFVMARWINHEAGVKETLWTST